MSKNNVSKEDLLKRYLEPSKKKVRGKNEKESIKYISGELPESLSAFHNQSDDLALFGESGENAPTVVRKVPASSYLDKTEEEKRKEVELKAKYDVWGKGIATLQKEEAKLQEKVETAMAPLARYADDEKLQEHLKEQLHGEDPMAEYFQSKKRKKKESKKKKKKKGKHSKNSDSEDDRPTYKGPEGQPNRFGIKPGYRWDGVDRGNGFEQKIMEERNKKQHYIDMSNKWSMADL